MPSMHQQDNLGWDIDEIREAAAQGIEQAEIEYFAKAQQLASKNARVLRMLAKEAYAMRRNRRALQIYTFEWGMSAGNMARAVVRRPEWFERSKNASVREMRMLFVLGQVDKGVDDRFFEYWRQHQNLEPWQMQRMITTWKKRKAKPKQKHLKLHAQALHIDLDSKLASFELATEDREPVQEVVEGAHYSVSLAPEGEAT